EVRVRAARPRTGAVEVGEPAVRSFGAAEPVRRDRVDEGDAPDGGRAVAQQLEHHAAAHAPADQVYGGQLQRLDQLDQVVGEVAQPAGGVDREGVGLAE